MVGQPRDTNSHFNIDAKFRCETQNENPTLVSKNGKLPSPRNC